MKVELRRLIEYRLHLVRHRGFIHYRAAGAENAVKVQIQHLPGIFIGEVDDVRFLVDIVSVGKQPRGIVALQVVVGGLYQDRRLFVRTCNKILAIQGLLVETKLQSLCTCAVQP